MPSSTHRCAGWRRGPADLVRAGIDRAVRALRRGVRRDARIAAGIVDIDCAAGGRCVQAGSRCNAPRSVRLEEPTSGEISPSRSSTKRVCPTVGADKAQPRGDTVRSGWSRARVLAVASAEIDGLDHTNLLRSASSPPVPPSQGEDHDRTSREIQSVTSADRRARCEHTAAQQGNRRCPSLIVSSRLRLRVGRMWIRIEPPLKRYQASFGEHHWPRRARAIRRCSARPAWSALVGPPVLRASRRNDCFRPLRDGHSRRASSYQHEAQPDRRQVVVTCSTNESASGSERRSSSVRTGATVGDAACCSGAAVASALAQAMGVVGEALPSARAR